MPQHYHTIPALFEQARCLLVRWLLSVTFTLFWLVTRLLPEGHPVRVFSGGRVVQLRETVLPATIPASHPTDAAIARQKRLWLAGLLFLGALVLGDVSASVPFDLFGLPDTHLGIGALLGLGDDDLLGSPHLLSTPLPWNNESRIGTALLLACIGTVYAMRPRALAPTD